MIEYQRAFFLYPDLYQSEESVDKFLNTAFLTGDPGAAREWARNIRSKTGSPLATCAAKYYEGRSSYDLGDFTQAVQVFEEDAQTCGNPWNGLSSYRGGVSLLRLHRWDEAVNQFSQVPPESVLGKRAAEAAAIAHEGKNLPRKSPLLAGTLSSLLPGAGYLYAKSPQTALAAFVANGLFIWGTVSAARKRERGVAAVIGIFAIGWYFGGIHGSAVAARRYNDYCFQEFMDRFEQK